MCGRNVKNNGPYFIVLYVKTNQKLVMKLKEKMEIRKYFEMEQKKVELKI